MTTHLHGVPTPHARHDSGVGVVNAEDGSLVARQLIGSGEGVVGIDVFVRTQFTAVTLASVREEPADLAVVLPL